MEPGTRKRKRSLGWQPVQGRHIQGLLCLVALAGLSRCHCLEMGVKECFRLAPHYLAADERTALCSQANTSAPADCARKAYKASGFSGPHIVELCARAVSEAPAACVMGLSRNMAKSLSPELKVELCKSADTDAPARCVGHSVQSKKQQQLVVDVCKGALNMAPADCLDLLPRSMPQETARRLCGQAETLGPALCANTPGQLSYGPDITARLCQGAVGQGPALCFRRSYLAARLPMENRMDLCYGAMSDAPARCVASIRDRHLSPSERVTLCRGTTSGAPAECLASTPPTVLARDRVILCQGATEPNPIASAECFKAIPHDLPVASAVALCREVADSRVAGCAKSARHIVGDSDDLVVLCRHASSSIPAHCAKTAFRLGAQKHLAAALCAGSTSLAPASCFAAAPQQISAALRAMTCTGAQSTTPGLCLVAAMPRGLRAQVDGAVCPLSQESGSPPRQGLDHRLAARLCQNASNDGPASCGHKAPLQMSHDDVNVLCAAAGRPQGESTARCATAALMAGLSSSSSATLCRGAGSNAPAVCASAVAPRIVEAGRVTLCRGASSNAPARCANSLPTSRPPSAEDLAECRIAVPRPSGLQITNLGHDGENLFPDQPIRATVQVLDQWGGEIPSDSSTVVRASIALQGSNGVTVNAHGRSNATINGLAHFSHISFSGSGSLTLQFSIDTGAGEVSVPLAAAHVIVAETEHGAIIRRCGRLFSSLACPLEARAARVSETREHEQSVPTEAVSALSGGAAAAWSMFTCQHILEANGVRVAYLSSVTTGPLTAWLWYHPGIETLETGAGLPTRDQPAWDRLGVDRDAGEREVRRAYYRQSLLWHPDRWVRHSMHTARAQEVFEVISEAYAWMVRDRIGSPGDVLVL